MNTVHVSDTWERGSPYELYIGRWSRKVSPLFLEWLDQPAGKRWLDVGCGTGALSAAIIDLCEPGSVVGIEPSEGFLKLAVHNLAGRASFLGGHAAAIPLDAASFDVVVSGLVLNFIPDLQVGLAEIRRVTADGGTIGAYVWDYADGMEIIRHFWDAAASLDPVAARLHEGARFPVCAPLQLKAAFERAGLVAVETVPLDVVAEFADFEDYWSPFLGGQGPAPAYAMSLAEEQRRILKNRLKSALPRTASGSIALNARAWAVRGTAHN